MKKICQPSTLANMKGLATDRMFFHYLNIVVSRFCQEVGITNLQGVNHTVLSLLCGQTTEDLVTGYQGGIAAPAYFFHEAVAIYCVNAGAINIERYEDIDDALDYLERNHPEFNDKMQDFLSEFSYNV